MTQPDHQDRAPGMGDPTRSDDTAIPGLRTGGAGAAAEDAVDGPAPQGGDNSPDGEDVQVQTTPGPQTDWLRTAPGEGRSGPHEPDR
jgi:hypothetical protein